ncbi:MAG: hypothetical protein LC104_19540 [Bacteroidales bacterium]|nr:hypothetical protein [Bacteroidales bacterium]
MTNLLVEWVETSIETGVETQPAPEDHSGAGETIRREPEDQSGTTTAAAATAAAALAVAATAAIPTTTDPTPAAIATRVEWSIAFVIATSIGSDPSDSCVPIIRIPPRRE